MNITQYTKNEERHGPLLAFRRATFEQDISTAEAAGLLLQRAQSLGLTDRQHLYGNTLNDWLTPGGKPPAWALLGAISWLESNGWYPGINSGQGNAERSKSPASDLAWWAYAKLKLHGSLPESLASIPTSWPSDIAAAAERALQESWQEESKKQQKRAEARHQSQIK